jgi:hypothetical protein
MLTNAAGMLTLEDVASLTYIHGVCCKAGREGSEGPKALEVLRALEDRGAFSAEQLEPLEDILAGINRHDVANSVVKDFRVEMTGVRRSDSDPTLPSRHRSWIAAEKHRVTMDTAYPLPDVHHTTSGDECGCSCSTFAPTTTDEKRKLLHTLMSDPDLKSDVVSLVGGEGLSTTTPDDSLQSCLPTAHRHNSESGVSVWSASSGFVSSPETSLPLLQRNSFDNGLPSSVRPQFHTQSSVEGFVNVSSPEGGAAVGGDRGLVEPHPPSCPSSCARKRMEWNINRVELGRRIVAHSNTAFIKGNFSLPASGVRSRLRKPVSLVFKVYPFGLGTDENQSLTLQTIVECRSEDLRLIGGVNLEVSVSVGDQFISTRTWNKPLRTFTIHDFLPHELITHSSGKTLNLVIQAYVHFTLTFT